MSRKHYAVQLFREGLAPRLLLSVADSKSAAFSKMALPIQVDLLKQAQDVPRHSATSLFCSKTENGAWSMSSQGCLALLRRLHRWRAGSTRNPEVQSVILISNEAHLRRIRMCCRLACPAVWK